MTTAERLQNWSYSPNKRRPQHVCRLCLVAPTAEPGAGAFVWRRLITVPQHQDDALAVAVDIFNQADRSGERITLGTVERRLAELASHPPDCGCGVCTAAANVTARGVYWIAANWQAQISVTRRRAAR